MRDLYATIGNLLGKYSNSKRPMKDKDGIYKGGDHNAIKHLRNGKAAGPDNVSADALKFDIRTNVELLYPLSIRSGKRSGYLQSGRKISSSSSPKSSCFNYRGITLLSIPGKVFNRVLLNKMP